MIATPAIRAPMPAPVTMRPAISVCRLWASAEISMPSAASTDPTSAVVRRPTLSPNGARPLAPMKSPTSAPEPTMPSSVGLMWKPAAMYGEEKEVSAMS
jgi:hypothetical protein